LEKKGIPSLARKNDPQKRRGNALTIFVFFWMARHKGRCAVTQRVLDRGEPKEFAFLEPKKGKTAVTKRGLSTEKEKTAESGKGKKKPAPGFKEFRTGSKYLVRAAGKKKEAKLMKRRENPKRAVLSSSPVMRRRKGKRAELSRYFFTKKNGVGKGRGKKTESECIRRTPARKSNGKKPNQGEKKRTIRVDRLRKAASQKGRKAQRRAKKACPSVPREQDPGGKKKKG